MRGGEGAQLGFERRVRQVPVAGRGAAAGGAAGRWPAAATEPGDPSKAAANAATANRNRTVDVIGSTPSS